MTARIATRGQDNWNYRLGYKRTQRVPAPIVSEPKGWRRWFR